MSTTEELSLKRLTCAFIAICAAMVAGIGYLLVFKDEMDPQAPANVGKGLLAPMWLRFVEFAIVESLTWPAVASMFYAWFGTPYEIEVMKAANTKIRHLHLVSGAILCAGVVHCLANGRGLGLADVIMGAAGTIALWHWFVARNRARKLITDLSPVVLERSAETRQVNERPLQGRGPL